MSRTGCIVSTPSRLRVGLATLVAALFCAVLAPLAHAGLSKWTSLSGLTASTKASWVRSYVIGAVPTTIYASTEGSGVYKSLDDGLTWKPFSTGIPTVDRAIHALYVAGGKVYAGTPVGLFYTGDTGSASGTWTPLAQGPEPDPTHPTKLNASVEAVISLSTGPMLAGTLSAGVYRSTDGGKTWKPPAAGNGMAASTTVWNFASFAGAVWAATSNGIYRSGDSGASWALKSDGLPFDVTLGVFQDPTNPLVYYAETASSGLFRSITGGSRWQSINGDPNHEPFGGSSTPTVHAVQAFTSPSQTRLYVATSDGLWVGTLSNQTFTGSPIWRHVTAAGLGTNTIMWGLSDFVTKPVLSTVLAGTQSNGGYALTFEAPANDHHAADLPSWTSAATLPLKVGTSLKGLPGVWTGTKQIDYAYAWQRCTSTAVGSCTNIGSAVNKNYTLTKADLAKYIRVVVTATNDAPSFVNPVAASTVRGPVAHAPGPLPGDYQESAPAIKVTPSVDQFLPTEGDVLSAPPSSQYPAGWLFKPGATTVAYKWLRCNVNATGCAAIPGATLTTYKLAAADDGLTIRVQVTGTNINGSKTLPVSGPTNQIIPAPAKQLSAPTLTGKPYVGSSLIGTVGTWASPATYWTRQWEQCTPAGIDCEPIYGATAPGYKVRSADVGTRLRMHVVADVNPSYQLPDAVDAYTPLTAVIKTAPVAGAGR